MQLPPLCQAMVQKAEALGAHKASCLAVSAILFDRHFRSLCEQNTCGNYGQNWTCPPSAGDIDALIQKAKGFSYALVYQTVGKLCDSYDFEGMEQVGKRHSELALQLRECFADAPFSETLHLGAGGCKVCERCAKRSEQACRHPHLAMASLETYGIAVSELAAACGMPYMHGVNTVTYFGAVLCRA